MQLSASPASIAPLSAAFLAPEPTAAPLAGAPADFAQVFANLGAGASSAAPVGLAVVPCALPAPAAAPAAAPENPAAALTCADVRTLFLPVTPPPAAVVPGQTMDAPVVPGTAAAVAPEDAPAVVPGQAQVRLSPSSRKAASTRGEAVPGSAPRAKSAPARPTAVPEATVAVTPPVAAPIVLPDAAVAPSFAPSVALVAPTTSASTPIVAQDAPPSDSDGTLAEVSAVAPALGREVGTETKTAPRARKPQPGAVRRHGNGGTPVAGPARWITPAASKPVTQTAAAPGQSEPLVVTGAGDGSLPATQNPAGVLLPTPEVGRVPLGFVQEEKSTVVPQEHRAAGVVRPSRPVPVSAPTPAETVIAAPAASVASHQKSIETGERANVVPVPAEVGRDRAPWATQESVTVPFVVEADETAEPSEVPSAAWLPEVDEPGVAAPLLTSSTWSRAPHGVAGAAATAERGVYPTENIAGRLNKNSQTPELESAPSLKHIESSSSEALTGSKPVVGTHVAKAQVSMPHAPTIPAAHDAILPSRVEFSVGEAVAVSPAVESDLPTAAAVPALAGKAVEAVLEAADRLATGDRSSVRLEFAMGESELSVRVALRDNAVRATFQTDSPELRAALVHEWQAVTAEPGTRTFQLAPPTFQSGPGESWSQGALTGDSSRQQRDGQPQHAGEFGFAGLPSGRRGTDSGATAAADSGRGRAELPAYSQHLHTHA